MALTNNQITEVIHTAWNVFSGRDLAIGNYAVDEDDQPVEPGSPDVDALCVRGSFSRALWELGYRDFAPDGPNEMQVATVFAARARIYRIKRSGFLWIKKTRLPGTPDDVASWNDRCETSAEVRLELEAASKTD